MDQGKYNRINAFYQPLLPQMEEYFPSPEKEVRAWLSIVRWSSLFGTMAGLVYLFLAVTGGLK
ncbi:MAG: hypothetical protein KKC80_07625 [Candidatus Margulisbacteria bacterium]|nr:hypothetical protein [Candidatus Margulisiibacteriota bacterium]MBU1617220.1 hypothetical protein [Candidatus Margulisiibacteriota bacterium]